VAYNDVNERNATHVTSNATVLLLRTLRPNSVYCQPYHVRVAWLNLVRASSLVASTTSTALLGLLALAYKRELVML